MKTKVYLTPSPPVEPFNDAAGDIQIANRSLAAWQAECFSVLGLEQVSVCTPPCLVLPENCFISSGALRQFLAKSKGRNTTLVLAESRFAKSSTPVQRGVTRVDSGWRFEGIRFLFDDKDAVLDVVVDPQELKLDLPMNNPYLDQDHIEIGLARHPVMQLDHWVHVLWANQIAGGMIALHTPKWLWFIRLAWAMIRRLSLNKWKILSGLNDVGKGCDIHPTAVIEGSTIGRNVTIGPYARVLMSKLDDGAVVMAGAQVEFSTLGKESMVSEHSVLRFSVLYPKAVASQYLMQQCILGRATVTTGGAFTMDLNFDREVRVPLDGELHDTGQHFLGCAFGHGARIGTGFWLASGRSIPNGYFLIRDPAQTLSSIPADLPTHAALSVRGRSLVAIEGATRQEASETLQIDDPSTP